MINSSNSNNIVSNNGTNFNQSILTKQEYKEIKSLKIDVPINNCYIIPKLNYIEATVSITDISKGRVLFKVEKAELLEINNKQLFPQRGAVVQVNVESFRNNKTNEILTINRDEQYFTPYIYSFEILDYLKEKNIGLANIISNEFTQIYLKNSSGIVYEYDVQDIGGRLLPIIKDSYLLL